MTARWWLIQQDIAEGKANVNSLQENVIEVFKAHQDTAYVGASIAPKGKAVGKCPVCGENVIGRKSKKTGKMFYTCSSNKNEQQEDGTWKQTAGCGFKLLGWCGKTFTESDLKYDPQGEGMKRQELFDRFLYRSSWHHTSRFFNETDFYSVDVDALADAFRPMTAEEQAEMQARQDAERAARDEAAGESRRLLTAKLAAQRAYAVEHGFHPDTVAAFAHEHPECCNERVSRKGNRVLEYIDYLGKEQVCLSELAERTRLYGFDATEPGSFSFAIASYLRNHSYDRTPKHDVTIREEAEQARHASAALSGRKFNDHGRNDR